MSRKKAIIDDGAKVKHRRPGRWIGPPPSKADLVKLYVNEERSVRDVAAALGCSKDAVYRALAEFRIKPRSNARRSKLRTIPIRDLKTSIQDRGISGTAREVGVDRSTLRHHLKVRKDR